MKMLRRLLPLAFVVSLTAMRCFGDVNGCPVEVYSPGPNVSMSVNRPAQCPIYVTQAGQWVDFAATIDVDDIVTDAQVRFESAGNAPLGGWHPVHFNTSGGSTPNDPYDDHSFSSVYGQYTANIHGQAQGTDYARVQFVIEQSSLGEALAFLSFQISQAVDLEGPMQAGPTEFITLSSTLHDPDLVQPVTYQWERNGVVLTGKTQSTLTTWVEGVAYADFKVTVTDVNGLSRAQSHRVEIAGGCDGFSCEGH